MDTKKEFENSFNHNIQLTERKNIIISGVKKLENFNSEEFFLESTMGFILIKGVGLELVKLDTFQGTLSIKGKIVAINYLDNSTKKEKNESLITKLFK